MRVCGALLNAFTFVNNLPILATADATRRASIAAAFDALFVACCADLAAKFELVVLAFTDAEAVGSGCATACDAVLIPLAVAVRILPASTGRHVLDPSALRVARHARRGRLICHKRVWTFVHADCFCIAAAFIVIVIVVVGGGGIAYCCECVRAARDAFSRRWAGAPAGALVVARQAVLPGAVGRLVGAFETRAVAPTAVAVLGTPGCAFFRDASFWASVGAVEQAQRVAHGAQVV